MASILYSLKYLFSRIYRSSATKKHDDSINRTKDTDNRSLIDEVYPDTSRSDTSEYVENPMKHQNPVSSESQGWANVSGIW